MNIKKINKNNFIIRIDKDEQIVESIKKACQIKKIKTGYIFGIGASSELTVGLFKTKEKEFLKKEFKGEYEITSINGNITEMNNKIYLHLHITFSDKDFNSYGGHLVEAVVSGTCELIITNLKGKVTRFFSNEVGLNLLDI